MNAAARALAIVALLLAVSAGANAESAPGNTLNPTGGDTTRATDPRGMSQLTTQRRRSPAGLLYPDPLEPARFSAFGDDWLYRGSVEFGGLWTLGDDRETRFNEHADWNDGAFLEFLSFGVAQPVSGFYAEIAGGSAGRDDQYFSGELGITGLVRLRGSFSGIPHTFTTDATNLYRGAGSGVLNLPASLTPGNNTDLEIIDALQEVGGSEVSLQRDRTQLSLDYRPHADLTLFARYSHEDRDGARPFGGSLIFDTGGEPERVVETTEPRDHRTHNISAGLQYRSPVLLANVEYNGSIFRNGDAALSWDNPFLLSEDFFGQPLNGADNVEQGRFALAPDNHWHNVKADVSASLLWDGRLTTTASWGRMRQDDDLVVPTVNSGFVGFGAFNGVDLTQWNDASALSRDSADAQVDTLLLNTRLHLRPLAALRLQAGIRYFDRQNDTRYTAFNPSTGELGYIAEDGALNVFDLSRVFVPGTPIDDFRYRSSPYDYQKLEYEFRADYRVLGRTVISGRYRREEIDRNERERDETREDQARVSLTSRDVGWATLRASYEYRDRDGSSYDSFPNRDDYVSSLEGFTPFLGVLSPNTLADLRKYELADRKRTEVKLSANLLPNETLDLSIAGRFVDEDFGAAYGLEEVSWVNANLDLNYQPSPAVQAYLFGHFELRDRKQSSINDAFAFSSDPSAGGPVFPFRNRWSLDTNEVSWGLGSGVRIHLLDRVIVDLNYMFISTEEDYRFSIASPGALGTGLSQADDLPQLRTRSHHLTTSIRFSIVKSAFLRVFYRFERATIRDFSQQGLIPEDVLLDSGALFLGHIDRDFDAHVVGITLGLRI
ncbi:MAG: MtrB/PioB family decaheme-associated outer membrane protein [Deltaproteobacteria bacterium]|nr:MtrB/PioB family decaheme-associated outer membrane protein [Deltaproteobacteria bacterium]